MKIYQVSWHDKDIGTMLHWSRSKQEAWKQKWSIHKEHDIPSSEIEIMSFDIPKGKANLVQWLNDHVQTENG